MPRVLTGLSHSKSKVIEDRTSYQAIEPRILNLDKKFLTYRVIESYVLNQISAQ